MVLSERTSLFLAIFITVTAFMMTQRVLTHLDVVIALVFLTTLISMPVLIYIYWRDRKYAHE